MAKREYNNTYPSVTTILGVLRKIGLENWFKVNTPQFIKEESNRGKQIGTEIHDVIHNYIETGKAKIETQYATEVTTALNSFMLFRKENPDIVLLNAEMPLTSTKYQYNGTIDCIGNRIIVDWKTANAKDDDKPKIYDEYLYQVAAYVYLWNECKNENIDRAVIVSVAKDKVAYNLEWMDSVRITDCFNEVFLSALKIYNYGRKK